MTTERLNDQIGRPIEIPLVRSEAGKAERMHLRDYWHIVSKRRWLVCLVVIIGTTLSAIYYAKKPDLYEARAQIQVDLENSNSIFGAVKGNSVVFNNAVNDPAYFNTQLKILSSPGLLRRVTTTLDLQHNDAFLDSESSAWQSVRRILGFGKNANRPKLEPGSTNRSAVTAGDATAAEVERLVPYVRYLTENLVIEPVKETRLTFRETRLIDISFIHTDRRLASKVSNTVADTFVLSNLENKTDSGATAGTFMQKRIAELQSQIRNGEERLINYAKSHRILSLDAGQNTVVERLVGLNKQLLEAENERKMAESAYLAAKSPQAREAMAEEGLAKRFIDEANLKLAELQQKRAQLLVENTETSVEVKELDKQIELIEKRIGEATSRAGNLVVTNLETKYRQAKTREEALRTAFDAQRNETVNQNEAATNYRIIQQEIDTNKGLLDGLLQRAKENDVMLAGTPNNIRVVDYAVVPDEPVGPRRLVGISLAFVIALIAAVGLALFLEYLDDTVRTTEEVEGLLQLPALALIPSVSATKITTALQRSNGAAGIGGHLLLTADSQTPLAEAYKQLRTSVLLSTPGRRPQTLLVTSSVPSEGKTTTSINIGISLAQMGAKVLIIDADMRRPRLHATFAVPNERGLSTILSGDGDQLLDTIQRHDESGLDLLTSGPIPPNPAELVGSVQMLEIIAKLKTIYTHIVIDSPPIASFTDGVLIAPLVDGVLLVVHGGKTSRSLARRSAKLLHGVGAKLYGVVLNNINVKRQEYYYYSQSHYRSDHSESGQT